MISITEFFFWASLIIIIYTYLGYPLLLVCMVAIKELFTRDRGQRSDTMPLQQVTLVIAAFNEESIILEKINNTQKLDYPDSLLQVIFVTDGSTDRTPELIRKHSNYTVLHEPMRNGKLAAMNRAMQHVKSGLVVFSDANGMLNSDSIRRIVPHYHHPLVGGVTGEKKVTGEGGIGDGEGMYWKYESFLKHLDSRLHTVVGAAGELMSLRTSLYSKLPPDTIIEDFVQSLMLCQQGYVVRYEPGACSVEKASASVRDEMERKVRIAAGGFQAMKKLGGLFNLFRYPVTGFQFISHRVLRWTLCPLALVVLFVSTWLLYVESSTLAYLLFGGLQLAGYLGGAIGWYYALNNRKHPLFYLPFYFMFMNFCVFSGFYRFLAQRQPANWKKAVRT